MIYAPARYIKERKKNQKIIIYPLKGRCRLTEQIAQEYFVPSLIENGPVALGKIFKCHKSTCIFIKIFLSFLEEGRSLSLLEFPSPNDAKLGNKWLRGSEEEDGNVKIVH